MFAFAMTAKPRKKVALKVWKSYVIAYANIFSYSSVYLRRVVSTKSAAKSDITVLSYIIILIVGHFNNT